MFILIYIPSEEKNCFFIYNILTKTHLVDHRNFNRCGYCLILAVIYLSLIISYGENQSGSRISWSFYDQLLRRIDDFNWATAVCLLSC